MFLSESRYVKNFPRVSLDIYYSSNVEQERHRIRDGNRHRVELGSEIYNQFQGEKSAAYMAKPLASMEISARLNFIIFMGP